MKKHLCPVCAGELTELTKVVFDLYCEKCQVSVVLIGRSMCYAGPVLGLQTLPSEEPETEPQ